MRTEIGRVGEATGTGRWTGRTTSSRFPPPWKDSETVPPEGALMTDRSPELLGWWVRTWAQRMGNDRTGAIFYDLTRGRFLRPKWGEFQTTEASEVGDAGEILVGLAVAQRAGIV